MQLLRRKFLELAAGATALPALSLAAKAESYPTRPVHVIVGFPEGGGPNVVAHIVGEQLSERLGQQFVVESRPGAGSDRACRWLHVAF